MDAAGTLLLLHVESPNRGAQGDTIYRTAQPCRALGLLPGLTVVSGSVLSPEVHALALRADVLVLCDVVDADFLPVLAARRAAKRLSVYEVNDDFLAPQPWNPLGSLAQNPLTRSLSSQLASRCDGVQFTVPELRRRFGHLSPRGAVFANQLWEAPPASEKPARLRVGWGGSDGHLEDLRAVAPELRRFLGRHPEVQLAIMGAKQIAALFDGLPPGQLDWRPPGSLADYYAFVGSLHVGLCPLLPTDFNRCRSEVKLLETAALGAVPVCADLEPYRGVLVEGETGFLFRDAEGLGALLERLAGDPALRSAVQARASRWARTERLERPRAVDRLETYRAWARELGYPFEPRPHPELAEAGLPDGAAYTPLAGTLPSALYQALLLARSDPAAAAKAFAGLADRAPGFYLPRLYQARSEADPGRAARLLEEALALAPASCAAAFLLGERLAEARRIDEARAALARCEALCPELGAAAARQGELLAASGSQAAALDCFRRAHAQNPFLAGPALQLALAALAARRAPEAVALLEEFVRRDDRLVAARLLLGRALIEAGRPGEAVGHLDFALGRSEDPVPAMLQLARAQSMLGQVQVARSLLEEAKRRGAKA